MILRWSCLFAGIALNSFSRSRGHMNRVMRKPTIWIPNMSNTNRAVQAQKMLEAGNSGIGKKRNCTIREAKKKALISFAVTTKLISAFVFACVKC